MLVGGLDIGSTGAKITVMNQTGEVLHYGYRDYPVDRNVSTHEINGEDVLDATKMLLQEAMKITPTLSAIGVTSFGESFVLLDENDRVLMPTLMYTDPRGEDEVKLLKEKLGDDFINATAGTAAHNMYSLPKLMWIKTHLPEIFSKTKRVCLMVDYLIYRLTGKGYIDYSLAARTLGFDIQKKQWSPEIFKAAGISSSLFSTPVPTGTDAGVILPKIAKELEISEEIRVVACCHDQLAAAIGLDVTEAGMATDSGGTVQCMTPVFSPIPENRILQENNYSIIPFIKDNFYCSYAYSFTGGALTKWFVDNFAKEDKTRAKEMEIPVYQLLEEDMKDEPTGILVLPHFAGAGTPYMDPSSRGAIVGLNLGHQPPDILRAIMEGIAYEMRINMECLAKGGIQINGLKATGGCAKSKMWLQMKADILGVPISRMSTDEAGTIGGIILTGVAVGAYRSLEEGVKTLVKPVETYYPRLKMKEQYDVYFKRYERLYHSLKPLIS